MEIRALKPRKALNKAFLKVKPNRTEIEGFKTNLITLLDRTNDTESEVYYLQDDLIKGNYELELDIDTGLRKLLTKIEFDTKPLSFYGRSYFGIQTFDRKEFVSKTKIDENYYPVIDGGNVKRYRYEPNTEFVSFKKESIKSGGDPLVYKKDRIVVRQIGFFPEGTIVEPNIMTLNTIYNIYLHNEDIHRLRFLLSLINSKLFQFYWLKKHFDNKATFPKIKKEPIESFPIKKADTETIKKHSELVLEILAKKSQDNTADTTGLENQLDCLVYELYELTEEEIEIVENG